MYTSTQMFYLYGTLEHLYIESEVLSFNFGITLPFLSAENRIPRNQDQDPILKQKTVLRRSKNSAIVNIHDA